MIIPIIASIIRALWIVGEILHQRGQQVRPLKNHDRNSGRLWDVANAIEPVGMILGFAGIGRIQTGSSLVALAGLTLLILGVSMVRLAYHIFQGDTLAELFDTFGVTTCPRWNC